MLSNLIADQVEPVCINSLVGSQIASSRVWLDDVLGFESSDLYSNELLAMRPKVYEWSNKQSAELVFHKTHDANIEVSAGVNLFPPDSISKVVYIIRNPLDVVVSLSNHMSFSIDQAIMMMNKCDYVLAKESHRSLYRQVGQPLHTWSHHVKSWVDNPQLGTCSIRYEDMQAQPVNSFGAVATYLGLSFNKDSLNNAIRSSSFDALSAQETAEPFNERSLKSKSFFRKGTVGNWRTTLDNSQIGQIVDQHHEIMRRFGYVDETNQPLGGGQV